MGKLSVMIKAVIFDLDGTLIESHEDVWDSIQLAFESVGYTFPISLRQDNALLSLSPIQILHMIYPHASSDITNRYVTELRWQYTEACNYHKTQLYPGIIKLLNRLNGIKIPLYITTMKSKLATSSILSAKHLEHLFTAVLAPDSLGDRKLEKWELLAYILEHYPMVAKDYVMIGDTPPDLRAAHLVGIPCVGVTWGYGQLPELSAQNPVMIASSVEELAIYLFSQMG
jgi:phosphoglycolate phosphatase